LFHFEFFSRSRHLSPRIDNNTILPPKLSVARSFPWLLYRFFFFFLVAACGPSGFHSLLFQLNPIRDFLSTHLQSCRPMYSLLPFPYQVLLNETWEANVNS
jgi:hypothetical protein